MDAFEQQKSHEAQILEAIDKKSTSRISGKHFTHFSNIQFRFEKKKNVEYNISIIEERLNQEK